MGVVRVTDAIVGTNIAVFVIKISIAAEITIGRREALSAKGKDASHQLADKVHKGSLCRLKKRQKNFVKRLNIALRRTIAPCPKNGRYFL